MNLYKRFFKRFFDILISGIALCVLIIPLGLISIWLYFANKGAGVFFTQERPGIDEKIFKIYKFKSMTDERDADGNLLPDAQRITAAGRFVRATSIDELPQLWNVFIGEMSVIGPRPLLPRYLPWYNERERHRHDVRPGITGLAQINGRNHLSWDERFEMDVQYVENLSLVNDLKIIGMSVLKTIKRSDITVAPGDSFFDIDRQLQLSLNNQIGAVE